MLDQLVESRATAQESGIRNLLLVGTMLTVCLAFVLGLGYSLFAQNFIVSGGGLELSTLVAPPIPDEAPPPPEPEPDKPAPKQAANVDVRKEIIANIMENPKKVVDIKTSKMEIKARRENVPTIKGDVESNTYSSSKPPPTKRDLEGANRGFTKSEGKAKPTPKPPEKKAAPPPPPPPPKPPVPKRISKGVVNGSAISLPKPRYPAAARAVNAKGSVSVAIVISKSGRVMSASARSGHPLLKQAAVAAARRAKFRPTLLSGQAVEVSGVIVYNFQ